jgi:hypothetical protein
VERGYGQMSAWRITREQLWYGLAFALALLLRLVMLGAAPLSESEAALALQSLGIAHGARPELAAQPGTLMINAALFYIFAGSNFLARLWPAVSGSLLVLAPLGFRRQLGGRAALVLAFFLALDPGLVALSRQVSSPLPAITFALFAVGLWLNRRPLLAGITAGLALLGGPQIWAGLIAASLALAIAPLFSRRATGGEAPESHPEEGSQAPASSGWIPAGIAALLTLGLVATLFWLAPQGLSAFGASVAAYFATWTSVNGISAGLLLAALLSDEILFILLAVWGVVNGIRGRSRVDTGLGLWALAALALAFIPAGRQTAGLAWALIPLLALAARGIAALQIGSEEKERLPAWIYTAAVLFLLGFTWLNFTGILSAWKENADRLTAHTAALSGGIVLLVVATILVGWGWSRFVAAQGVLRGLLIVLAVSELSAATSSAGWRLTPPADLWGSYPRPEQARFLGETVGDLSYWRTGNRDALDLTVSGIQSPALEWSLRGMGQAQIAAVLGTTAQPSLVITPQQVQPPQLAAAYRGQNFLWDVSPDWSSMDALDWLSWIAFRTAPQKQTFVILWARSDVFLGATVAPGITGQ